MGEGASNQGDFHEGLNFVGIHKLPMIQVVENNGYVISVPAALECAVEDVASRAAGYNMPGVIVDGTDVLACYVAARTAVARARAGDGGTLIEAKVTRLTGHSSDDQQTKVPLGRGAGARARTRPAAASSGRSFGTQACWTTRPRHSSRPRSSGTWMTPRQYAESQPDPTPESATWYVYDEDRPGGPATAATIAGLEGQA